MKIFSVFFFLAFVSLVLAQTNTIDPLTAPLPTDVHSYWQYAIAIVSPIIIYIVRWLVPKIPAPVLPVIAPVVGVLLGLIVNGVTKAHLGWIDTAMFGALGVWVRELVNQNITKRLQKEAVS